MNELFLFAWGTLATAFAVGPLVVAFYLDRRSKS